MKKKKTAGAYFKRNQTEIQPVSVHVVWKSSLASALKVFMMVLKLPLAECC